MGKLLVIGSLFIVISTLSLPTVFAQVSLGDINQKVCDRFEEDLVRMSAIMEELRRRKGITETKVAFGGYDTPIKQADYLVTFAAEALAYQRAKQYSSPQRLRADLEVLKGKLLKAKTGVGKALDEE